MVGRNKRKRGRERGREREREGERRREGEKERGGGKERERRVCTNHCHLTIDYLRHRLDYYLSLSLMDLSPKQDLLKEGEGRGI